MNLGQRIKEKRCERGLSQHTLALKTNKINQSQISKIEQGKRKISTEDLFSIAKALDVEAKELINEVEG